MAEVSSRDSLVPLHTVSGSPHPIVLVHLPVRQFSSEDDHSANSDLLWVS